MASYSKDDSANKRLCVFLYCRLLPVGKSILLFFFFFSPCSDCEASMMWLAPASDIWDYVNTHLKIYIFITHTWVLTVAYFLQAGLCYPLLSCTSLSCSDVSLAQYFTVFSAGFVCAQYCWGQRLSEVIKWRIEDPILHTDLAQYVLISPSWQPRTVSFHSVRYLLLLIYGPGVWLQNGHKDEGCWGLYFMFVSLTSCNDKLC